MQNQTDRYSQMKAKYDFDKPTFLNMNSIVSENMTRESWRFWENLLYGWDQNFNDLTPITTCQIASHHNNSFLWQFYLLCSYRCGGFFCQLVALTSAFVMNHGFPKNLAPQRKNNLRLDAVVKRWNVCKCIPRNCLWFNFLSRRPSAIKPSVLEYSCLPNAESRRCLFSGRKTSWRIVHGSDKEEFQCVV